MMKNLFLTLLVACISPLQAQAQLTYAVTIAEGATFAEPLNLVIDGGGTHGCLNNAAADVEIAHSTLADCSTVAINVAASMQMSNAAVWCDADADCDITVAADKELTGSHNAWRVAPAGDGTDSTTDNILLTACPFRNCYNSLLVKRGSPLVRAGTDRKHIGYYQNRIGGGDFSPGFEFR